MAARVTDRLWDVGDIVKLIEEWEVTDKGVNNEILYRRADVMDRNYRDRSSFKLFRSDLWTSNACRCDRNSALLRDRYLPAFSSAPVTTLSQTAVPRHGHCYSLKKATGLNAKTRAAICRTMPAGPRQRLQSAVSI
jgi:hypothetical protein